VGDRIVKIGKPKTGDFDMARLRYENILDVEIFRRIV
jgi:hypothetical protein